MNPDLLAIIFGLASAASWGTGDFSGGLATKRASIYSVIIISQLIGGLLLFILAIILGETIPSTTGFLYGAIAGICGAFGLVALYSGLATKQMGVVAPVAAVVTTIIPIIVALITEGLPTNLQLLGFGLALAAVWFLSRGNGTTPIKVTDLGLPVAAGLGFGLFFIFIDQVAGEAILWPLVSARLASVTLFSIIARAQNKPILPPRDQLVPITLAGIFDTGGNAFFALATRFGRLDIAAVLSSLYPAITVLWAWIILKETLGRLQLIGILATLAALILIAL